MNPHFPSTFFNKEQSRSFCFLLPKEFNFNVWIILEGFLKALSSSCIAFLLTLNLFSPPIPHFYFIKKKKTFLYLLLSLLLQVFINWNTILIILISLYGSKVKEVYSSIGLIGDKVAFSLITSFVPLNCLFTKSLVLASVAFSGSQIPELPKQVVFCIWTGRDLARDRWPYPWR